MALVGLPLILLGTHEFLAAQRPGWRGRCETTLRWVGTVDGAATAIARLVAGGTPLPPIGIVLFAWSVAVLRQRRPAERDRLMGQSITP